MTSEPRITSARLSYNKKEKNGQRFPFFSVQVQFRNIDILYSLIVYIHSEMQSLRSLL